MKILLACEEEKIGNHWPLTTPYFEQVLYLTQRINNTGTENEKCLS